MQHTLYSKRQLDDGCSNMRNHKMMRLRLYLVFDDQRQKFYLTFLLPHLYIYIRFIISKKEDLRTLSIYYWKCSCLNLGTEKT